MILMMENDNIMVSTIQMTDKCNYLKKICDEIISCTDSFTLYAEELNNLWDSPNTELAVKYLKEDIASLQSVEYGLMKKIESFISINKLYNIAEESTNKETGALPDNIMV